MLTLLLYVLIVGLVAAVLFLLAGAVFGRAEELGPLPEGTTATVLPAAGIAGADVRSLRFQQVVRGYKAAEVDWALARLAERIDELQHELALARAGQEGPLPATAGPTADGRQAVGPAQGAWPGTDTAQGAWSGTGTAQGGPLGAGPAAGGRSVGATPDSWTDAGSTPDARNGTGSGSQPAVPAVSRPGTGEVPAPAQNGAFRTGEFAAPRTGDFPAAVPEHPARPRRITRPSEADNS